MIQKWALAQIFNPIAYCVLRKGCQIRSRQYVIGCLSGILLLFIPVSTTLAHGGGQLQVGPVAAGPYRVSVWTDPPTPRVDRDLHITVAVADGLTNEPVLNTAVTITIYPGGSQTAVARLPATAEAATNRLFYEADLRLPVEGDYLIDILVTGPDGTGQVDFPLTLAPALPLTWLYLLLVAGTLLWGYYWWQKRPVAGSLTAPSRRPVRPRRPRVD
jgi:hypothetical protein